MRGSTVAATLAARSAWAGAATASAMQVSRARFILRSSVRNPARPPNCGVTNDFRIVTKGGRPDESGPSGFLRPRESALYSIRNRGRSRRGLTAGTAGAVRIVGIGWTRRPDRRRRVALRRRNASRLFGRLVGALQDRRPALGIDAAAQPARRRFDPALELIRVRAAHGARVSPPGLR